MGLIEQDENYRCLVYCGDSCVCSLRHTKFKSTMPMVKKSKPQDFMTAMNKMLKWMRKNHINGGDIIVHALPNNGGYIRLQDINSITVDFTHWTYPPIKSAKQLLKKLKPNSINPL